MISLIPCAGGGGGGSNIERVECLLENVKIMNH